MPKVKYSPRRGSGRRSYAGADGGRLFSDWVATNQSGDAELYGSVATLRARCRSLERENPYFARWLAEIEANVLGDSGIRLTMDVRTKRGARDQRISRMIEDAWMDFSKRGNFTACRQLDRLSWARVALRSIARDGDCLIELVRGYPKNRVGFALQTWEADHLDARFNDDQQGIKMGVEKDPWGEPRAFHMYDRHPGDNLLGYVEAEAERRRLPAEGYDETKNLGSTGLLPFIKRRFSQSRGEPWGTTAIRQLRQLNQYEEAALVAARVGAAKMAIIFEPGDEVGGADMYGTRRTMSAEPGAIEVIPVSEPGEVQFQSWDPSDPNNAMPDFVTSMLRGIASGLQSNYAALSSDYSSANYSSMRAASLSEREIYKMIQHWWIDQVERPVFVAWLDWAIATGALPLPYSEFDRWCCPIMEGRKWDWVDPSRDIAACEKAIELGLTSKQAEARKRGRTFREIVEETAEDNATADAAGVTFAAPAPAPAMETAPDTDDDAGE